MKHTGKLSTRTLFTTWSFLLTLTLISQSVLPLLGQKSNLVKNSRLKTEQIKEPVETAPLESSILPTKDFGVFDTKRTENIVPQVGVDSGSESEPNGTAATADALTGTEGKIRGVLWVEVGVSGADTDFYSFTTSAPNTRIYAATMSSFTGTSNNDTTLAVIASDGTTVLETDLNDGTFTANSSTIAGTLLATPGTYYLRVTNAATGTPISSYDLYFALRDAAPTPEVEPNDNGGTPNPLPASGLISGTITTAADTDTYSLALNAGDTVYLSLDADPERDNVQWNARLGLGLFGTPQNYLVANDASTGSAANPLSEAVFMTVKNAGTYIIYVDAASGAAATATYHLSATVVPAPALSCTTYTNNTATPIADAALTSSTIIVPGSPIIRKLRVYLDITHPLTTDLDVNLVSPANNNNGLFTDITTVGTQTAPQINLGLDDDAALPIGVFQINSGMIYKPEASYRLGWFNGENAGGTWTLDIRDDAPANTGTLNSWSLEVCTDPATPPGNLVYSENFESSNGGYTSSGTLNEWEYGTPNTTVNAPFTTCASGTSCWKTDLDNTYEVNSSQDLTSPALNLTSYSGVINLYWQQRYQIESMAFDRMWVRVTEVGNPTNTRIVWYHNSPTMNTSVGTTSTAIPESAGWGRYSADISDFAGKIVQVTFHLDSDSTIQLSGWAIDDVQLYNVSPTAANVGVEGRVVDAKGSAISRALVTLTGSDGVTRSVRTNTFGYYRFDTVEVGDTYILNAERKGYLFSPRVLSVQDEISDADLIAIE